jgi:multimeric flavodoxin WrbA
MVALVAIMGSPHRHGNTEKLLDQFINGAEKAGAEVHKIILCDLDIHPCKGCNACHKTGSCIFEDDGTTLFELINTANGLIIASPVFTMSVPAEVKGFIDRAHYLWARRFVLRSETLPKGYGSSHHAWFFATAGMSIKTRSDVFDAMVPILDVLFNNLGYTKNPGIFADAMDEYGGIEGRPELLEQAYQLGEKGVQELLAYDNK